MGSLFDELKKAKLLDEKRAKRIAHEQRVERKRKGGAQAEDEERARRRAEFERRRREEAETQRRSAKERRKERARKERLAELKQRIASRMVVDRGGGLRRWHFVAQGGRLPFLPVSDETARRLEAGELGIVRDPGSSWPRYVIVPRELALALRELQPDAVCFLAG